MKIKVVTDQDYLGALLEILSRAEKSIDIISFSFAIGSASGKVSYNLSPFKIIAKLEDLKTKNPKLKIRFFTEGERETAARNTVTAHYLESIGAEVKYGATHAKGFLIDKKIILFGSTNLTQQSIMKNHEANLLIEDPSAAREFQKYFTHLWNGGEHGEVSLKKPFLPDGEFKDKLIDMVDRAEKTIDFSIYFFNHREIEEAIIDAHERGVKVRGFIHQHNAFALPYIWANRSTVKRMKNKGIKDLYFGRPSIFSHSKYIVTDRKEVLLGTGNWLQEDVHIHPQLYCYLNDPKVAKSLLKHLEHQINSVIDSAYETRQ